MSRRRDSLTSLAFVVAGLLFFIYPALRPFSDETTLQGATAFASTAWIVSHSFAIAGFILIVLGLFGIFLRLQHTTAETPALMALVLSWIGAGLTLPFYGAEVFGLHAIGLRALKENNAALVSLADVVRGEPGIWFILVGLAVLGLGVIIEAIAIWRSRTLTRWVGIPLALGFALYIPQFEAPQALRVAHGLLITFGCLLIAWTVMREEAPTTRSQAAG